MKNMSCLELSNCYDYAEKVIAFYKFCNHGKIPSSKSEAELCVREYNNEHRRFKAMYGYSIKGYINEIVAYILCEQMLYR